MDIIIEAISTAAFIIGVFFGPAIAVEAYKAVRS
jgi:hypothetical protein